MTDPEKFAPKAQRRLHRAHFMHFRAVVEGVDVRVSAERYLGADGPTDAREVNTDAISALRLVAAREAADVWPALESALAPAKASAARPSLDEWALANDIDPGEWSEAELLEHYTAAHPEAAQTQDGLAAKMARAANLEALRKLEDKAAEPARGEHPIAGWFEEVTASRLERAGIERIDELRARVAAGGHWHAGIDAIGPTKAAAIAAYLERLTGPLPLPSAFVPFGNVTAPTGAHIPLEAAGAWDAAKTDQAGHSAATMVARTPQPDPGGRAPAVATQASEAGPIAGKRFVDHAIVAVAGELLSPALRDQLAAAGLDGSVGHEGANRVVPSSLAVDDDLQAAAAWLCARAGQPGTAQYVEHTAIIYRQQVRRLLLWCGDRRVAVSSMTWEDCQAFMAFLAELPDSWISRRRAPLWSPDWRPFARRPSASNIELCVRQISSMFTWLVDERYLEVNPWRRIKLRQPDDAEREPRAARSLAPAAWAALLAYLDHPDLAPMDETPRARQACAERERMRFVLNFNEPLGLRATELVSRRLSHLSFDGQAWTLRVHGKGAKNRRVTVPGQAIRALERYLSWRKLPRLVDAIEQCPDAPLVVQLERERPLAYSALYDAFKQYVASALAASDLSGPERRIALRASPHWLRHTTAMRLHERKVDPVVIKDHLGHDRIETTMGYLKTDEDARREQVERAFN